MMPVRRCNTGLERLVRQVPRFALVGMARTLFSLCVYWGLNLFLPYALSFTISFCATIALSASLSSRFVFVTQLTVPNIAAYAVVFTISYLLSLGLLILAIEVIGVGSALAPLLIMPVIFPFNFLVERKALSLRQRSGP